MHFHNAFLIIPYHVLVYVGLKSLTETVLMSIHDMTRIQIDVYPYDQITTCLGG